MRDIKPSSLRLLPCVVAAGLAFGLGVSPAHAQVRSSEPVYTQSMQKLQQSAQNLRESIQALARKPPGPERDRAISNAHEALLETQRAMLALPPELRTTGTTSTANYDESVTKLMKTADSLRQSIQEMAQQPPGERRNRAIAEAHKALRDTQAAMLSAHQPANARSMGAAAGQKSNGKAAGGGSAQAGTDASVLVLLPPAMARDTRFADGCWVRFFDDKQFRGDALTLAGPVDMPKMELPGGLWRDWDSAVVGPRARVTTYDNENFRDRTAELAANQSYPDLRDHKLGWFEEVKSARVSCG